MERLMRYKTLQCFLAALIMIAFLAPAAYASGTPDAYEASANAVSEKYIGKTVPGACVVISEYDNTVFAKGYGFADLENNTAMDPETTVFEWGSISKTFVWVSVMQLVEDRKIDLIDAHTCQLGEFQLIDLQTLPTLFNNLSYLFHIHNTL